MPPPLPAVAADFAASWFDLATTDRSLIEGIDAFEAGFSAVWTRAHRTLGEVTLTAIGDRVLYVAAERHPATASLELGPAGIRDHRLRVGASTASPAHRTAVLAGLRFVLTEFVTVLGTLTGAILTEPIAEALRTCQPTAASPAATAEPRTIRPSGEVPES